MQKPIIVLLLGLFISLTACEKTYVCTCVTSDPAGIADPVVITTEYTGTKRFAEDECATGNAMTSVANTNCTLD